MGEMNPQIDAYIADGCGRCEFYKTAKCKVNTWRDELIRLRAILLQTKLTEELKWSNPCYTLDNANIVMLSALKDYSIPSPIWF